MQSENWLGLAQFILFSQPIITNLPIISQLTTKNRYINVISDLISCVTTLRVHETYTEATCRKFNTKIIGYNEKCDQVKVIYLHCCHIFALYLHTIVALYYQKFEEFLAYDYFKRKQSYSNFRKLVTYTHILHINLELYFIYPSDHCHGFDCGNEKLSEQKMTMDILNELLYQ